MNRLYWGLVFLFAAGPLLPHRFPWIVFTEFELCYRGATAILILITAGYAFISCVNWLASERQSVRWIWFQSTLACMALLGIGVGSMVVGHWYSRGLPVGSFIRGFDPA